MPTPVSIGQRFTQLIQHLGLSKNAFAQSLDKTATVIQHLVDERNKPGYDLLCKVFEVYPNVSKDWLMEGAGPMLKTDAPYGATAAAALPALAVAPANADLFAAPAPLVAEPMLPVAPLAPAPAEAAIIPPPVVVAPVPVAPVVAATPAPMPPVATATAPPTVAAPDPAYLTAALQTQYLQHQLALAEQRNQHLLEQQALMQQLVAVLQRSA
ncbi:MAG: helix-turn-helix domain-containing protein [Janthinobacterium lividum]